MFTAHQIRSVSACGLVALTFSALSLASQAQGFAEATPEPPRNPPPVARVLPGDPVPQGEPRRLIQERSGSLAAPDGSVLRVATDIGNIRIIPRSGSGGTLNYRVRIESSAVDETAAELSRLAGQFVLTARSTRSGPVLTGRVPWRDFRGRLWVRIEIEVPGGLGLDLNTQAGSVETGDVDGALTVVSGGGNLTFGSVASSARLKTKGGHITVRDVHGDLIASTAGGHINAGNVQGAATLHSGGGHVRAVSVRGLATLETVGGNISVFRASANVSASSGGGRIDLGQLSGVLTARTGGGGVRVAQVVGPSQLTTGGGSLYLTRVEGPVNASTGSGAITAWFVPDAKFEGVSRLESSKGDILVYIPRDLAITIDARILQAGEHRVEADQGFPIKVSYENALATAAAGAGATVNSRTIRAECSLNGGGDVLQLRAVAGNIRLKFVNGPLPPLPTTFAVVAPSAASPATPVAVGPVDAVRINRENIGRIEELQRRVAERIWGRIRVTSAAQHARLVHSVRPEYPLIAEQSRVEGTVRLEVTIAKDGSVEDVKVLSGHTLLVAPAKNAVAQWRYRPTLVAERPVTVITTVSVAFRLK